MGANRIRIAHLENIFFPLEDTGSLITDKQDRAARGILANFARLVPVSPDLVV